MSEDPQLPGPDALSDAAQPGAEAALAALDAALGRPLAEQAEAFEAFHSALSGILDTEPAE